MRKPIQMQFLRYSIFVLFSVACLSLSCVLLGSLWSCDLYKADSPRAEEPTQLINEIRSYTSLRKFMEAYPQAELVPSGNSHPGDRWRPQFEVKRVTLPSFNHYGEAGSLEVSFFNDRLTSTAFYPFDVDRYLAELKNHGIQIRGNSANFSTYTFIRIATDYQGNRYVGWEDKRLAKEINNWIKNNA